MNDVEELERNEDDVLIACALRFDGYRYGEQTGFCHGPDGWELEEAGRRLLTDGPGALAPEEQLTLFFLLQRFLYKWGGEYEPRHGWYWRLFRSLYLLVYDYPVAAEYRHGEYTDRWDAEYRPRLGECVALVRRMHEQTQYDDSGAPDR
jgi:hypothetical protein